MGASGVMYQSIPAVPIFPGQPQGICSCCQSQGLGIRNITAPREWALGYPGATPGHLTHFSFRTMDKFIGKDEAFVKDWLVLQRLEKLVNIFKGMFCQF